jgi:hypothetical protein
VSPNSSHQKQSYGVCPHNAVITVQSCFPDSPSLQNPFIAPSRTDSPNTMARYPPTDCFSPSVRSMLETPSGPKVWNVPVR